MQRWRSSSCGVVLKHLTALSGSGYASVGERLGEEERLGFIRMEVKRSYDLWLRRVLKKKNSHFFFLMQSHVSTYPRRFSLGVIKGIIIVMLCGLI